MAIPSGYSLLGRIGYNDRGVYSENNEYVRGDVVYHEGSSYVALTTVTGIAPTDDNTNWKYLAHGFGATELSEIDATDTSGFVGDAGTKVKGQTLIDKIAEYVMSKVVATDAFQTYLQKFLVDNCVTERSDLSLSAAQGKALQDQLATLNSNLSNKADKTSLSSYALKSDLNNIVTSENINPISFTAGETKTLTVKTNCNDYVPFIVRERKSGKPLVVANFWLEASNVSKIILYAPLSITNANIDIYFIKKYW